MYFIQVWGIGRNIPGAAELTDILTTIAWTASAQHASVNFGQYDFAGILLNMR